MTRDEKWKQIGQRYTTQWPKKIRPGRIIVHNHVLPSLTIGLRGFRIWWANSHYPNGKRTTDLFERCPCGWAPHLPEHYRVKIEDDESGWTREKIIKAFKRKDLRGEPCPITSPERTKGVAYDE